VKSPGSTIRKWSTDAESATQRLDYWIGAICEGFLEMTVTTPVGAAFESSLESVQLGPIGVNRVRGSAQDVYRTQTEIRRSRANYYYLLCKTNGAWSVAQNGRLARVKPGDVVLVDSRQPYEFHFPVSADTVSLELAPSWVESWLTDPEQIIGRPIDGDAGWGRALSAFVREMSPELAIARPLPAQVMADQVGALLALASGSEPGGTTQTNSALAAVKDRILNGVAERYAEPGLTAVMIARDLVISERTLHRSLSRAGITFVRLLSDYRIAAAARMLSEPRFDPYSVAGIGLRVGFSDPSHFIRQCRGRLGLTPGALRRRRADDVT
jgi:AraC-like DNA-binding protein